VQSPDNIKLELIKLINETKPVYPNLASRLDEMRRWIAKTKAGLLTRKKYVILLLAELIEDTTFWLTLQLMSDEERDVEFAKLTPAEKYWYQYLFPTWFTEKDPKLNTWKKNLMADSFEASDAPKISEICKHIKSLGGATLKPYIADLSMTTDLIASGGKELVLCVQLTSVRASLTTSKENDWLLTLRYWGILRGLLVSFNPMLVEAEIKIGEYIFRSSDDFSDKCYYVVSIDERGDYVRQL
jgi:hypothetical protein